jgi:hypothetical protein
MQKIFKLTISIKKNEITNLKEIKELIYQLINGSTKNTKFSTLIIKKYIKEIYEGYMENEYLLGNIKKS